MAASSSTRKDIIMSANTAITNNATKLAISTPKEIDLLMLVNEVADTKTKVGISLRGKHGDQSLFSGVCKLLKSMLGIAATDKLDEKTVDLVNSSIAQYWQKQMEKVLGYGEVQTITFDKPSATYSSGEVSDIRKNARVHVSASVPDGKERKFFTLTLLNGAKERLAKMHDNPGRYDRKDLQTQENKIAALEKEYDRLNKIVNS